MTIYGFQPSELHVVLREFSKCGDIAHVGSGRQDAVNWVHLHYAVRRPRGLLSLADAAGLACLGAAHRWQAARAPRRMPHLPGAAQNKYQAQRALQRNGELMASRTMVGVRRLDARHKQAADMVAQSEGSRVQSAPAALTPTRPYHVSASQLVRWRLPLPPLPLASVHALTLACCCAEDVAAAVAVCVGHDQAVRAGHLVCARNERMSRRQGTENEKLNA